MKKTINIHLCQQVFTLDEDACTLLENYLTYTRAYFSKKSDGEEIANDIENRVAELLCEFRDNGSVCITRQQVEDIMTRIGNPEELGGEDTPEHPSGTVNAHDEVPPINNHGGKIKRKLFRDPENAMIGGVISGLCQYFGLKDVTLCRLAYVVLCLFSATTLIIAYALFYFIMPIPTTPEERLQMRGEPINYNSINEEIKKGMAYTGQQIKSSKFKNFCIGFIKVVFFTLLTITALPLVCVLIMFLLLALTWIVAIPFSLLGATQSLVTLPLLYAEAELFTGLPIGITILGLVVAIISAIVILTPLVLIIKMIVKPSHSMSSQSRIKLALTWFISVGIAIALLAIMAWCSYFAHDIGAYKFDETGYMERVRRGLTQTALSAEDSLTLELAPIPALNDIEDLIDYTVIQSPDASINFIINDSTCAIKVKENGKQKAHISISSNLIDIGTE